MPNLNTHLEIVNRGTHDEVLRELVVMAREIIDAIESGQMKLQSTESAQIVKVGEEWKFWVSVARGFDVITSTGKVLEEEKIEEDVEKLEPITRAHAQLLAYSLLGWLRSVP